MAGAGEIANFARFFAPPPRDATAMESLRARRLNRLLRHAHRNCPFYRSALDRAGWSPAAAWSADDLVALPVVGREILRDRMAELLTSGVDLSRCRRRLTSGTSGVPIHIPTGGLEEWTKYRLWTQVYAACGLRPWHRQARFAFPAFWPGGPRLFQRLGLYRRGYFPMDAPADEKIEWLRRTRPDALFAWAAVLDEISRRLETRNERLRIPLVFSTSNALHPPVRSRVADRMQARVIDAYGAVETGPIAWDCPEGGYHVRHDATIVELLDDAGRPAARGSVAVTPLWRTLLPLIRVDLGDLAEWEPAPCRCGVPGPRFRALHGRAMDLVKEEPGGEWVAPIRLLAPMYRLPGIRQFQMVQESADRYILHIVPGPEFDAARKREAVDYYRREFGGRITVAVRCVPAVPHVPGGKPLPLVTLARRAAGGHDATGGNTG